GGYVRQRERDRYDRAEAEELEGREAGSDDEVETRGEHVPAVKRRAQARPPQERRGNVGPGLRPVAKNARDHSTPGRAVKSNRSVSVVLPASTGAGIPRVVRVRCSKVHTLRIGRRALFD